MRKLVCAVFILCAVASAQIRLANPATWSNNYIGSNVRRYDVVMQYGASGMKTTTTLSASSGATSATVGSCSTFYAGQGFYIVGAAAAGAIFVDSVVSCSGTTLTWNSATGTTVSGATVGHEDSVAVNKAIADAFNAGGGEVFLPNSYTDGIYKCAVLNTTTGGCFTFPQNTSSSVLNPVFVEIVGESLGTLDQATNLFVQRGAALDCSLAPNVATVGSGVGTSCIAGAPYVTSTSGNYPQSFNALAVGIKDVLVFTQNQTKMHGLMMGNVLQFRFEHTYVVSMPDSADTWSSPTGATVGVFLPQYLNNVDLYMGSGTIAGFNTGVAAGEHTIFDGTYLSFNNYCLGIVQSQHAIGGRMRCESSPHMILNNSASKVVLDLTIDGEVTPGAGTWWQRGTDVTDASNLLNGSLKYMFLSIPSAAYSTVTLSGGSNLLTCNIGVAPTAGVCTP